MGSLRLQLCTAGWLHIVRAGRAARPAGAVDAGHVRDGEVVACLDAVERKEDNFVVLGAAGQTSYCRLHRMGPVDRGPTSGL